MTARSIAVVLIVCIFATIAQAGELVLVRKSGEPARGTGLRLAVDPDAFEAVLEQKAATAIEFPMPDGSSRIVHLMANDIPLFAPGAVLTIVGEGGTVSERPVPDAQSIYGEVEGEPDSVFSLVRVNGLFAGSLRFGGKRYDIVPGDGLRARSTTIEIVAPVAPAVPRPACAVADGPARHTDPETLGLNAPPRLLDGIGS